MLAPCAMRHCHMGSMACCRMNACRARCPAQPFIQTGVLLLRLAGRAAYVGALENFKNAKVAGTDIRAVGLKFSRNARRWSLVQDRHQVPICQTRSRQRQLF